MFELNKLKNNKKAQISSTLTWFVAFLIIFFIIIIFLSATLILTGKKRVSEGSDEINLIGIESNLESLRFLINLLESSNNQDLELSIKQFLIKWADSKEDLSNEVSDEIRTLIEKKTDECYIFKAWHYRDEKAFTIFFSELREKQGLRGYLGGYSEGYKESLLEKGNKLSLFSENKQIKIEFYVGEC